MFYHHSNINLWDKHIVKDYNITLKKFRYNQYGFKCLNVNGTQPSFAVLEIDTHWSSVRWRWSKTNQTRGTENKPGEMWADRCGLISVKSLNFEQPEFKFGWVMQAKRGLWIWASMNNFLGVLEWNSRSELCCVSEIKEARLSQFCDIFWLKCKQESTKARNSETPKLHGSKKSQVNVRELQDWHHNQ